MIAVIDSGGANLSSIVFAFKRLEATIEVTSDPEFIRNAEKVILPGVGAAGSVMAALETKNLVDCIRSLTQPVLGICLGMQILFDVSDEGPVPGLGLIDGRVQRIPFRSGLPVPHMGWNRVKSLRPSALLGEDEGAHFYFVHSFAVPMGPSVSAVADYGVRLPAIVERQNWFGVQFHPERSGPAGARVLKRFLDL